MRFFLLIIKKCAIIELISIRGGFYMQYLFGVDVGGTTVKIGLVSYDGKLLDSFEIKTNTSDEGEHILSDIRDAIYAYLSKNNINSSDVLGIGFGVPGPVTNNVVNCCINLGWKVKNIEEEFGKLLDWNPKIACSNDANVAALGEMNACEYPNVKNAVMFTLGTGVGGGIILNNKILDGTNGAAGELGHLHLDTVHNYKCNCGLTGCLETVASATGVVRLAKEYLQTMPSSLSNIDVEKLSCKDIFDAAKEGDKLALEVVDKLCYNLGWAAASIAAVTNPQVIVIGGGVSKAGKFLLDKIEENFMEKAFHACKNAKFALATLGNDAGMYGAAALILN
jgi:glucokinase